MIKFKVKGNELTAKVSSGLPDGMSAVSRFTSDTVSDSTYSSIYTPSVSLAAKAAKIGGRTLIWNQLWNHANTNKSDLNTDGGSATINGVTWVRSGYTYTATGTASTLSSVSLTCNIPVGHTLLIKGSPSGYSTTNICIRLRTTGGSEVTSIYATTDTVVTLDETTGSVYQIMLQVQSGSTVESAVYTPQIFDLTKMFGTWKKPTLAAFNKWRSSTYAYEAGTVLNSSVTRLVYYSGSSNTTVFNVPSAILNLDDYGVGLGDSVYNYLDLNSGKMVKRIGVVDLGTLNWAYNSSAGRLYFYAPILDLKDYTLNLLTTNGYDAAERTVVTTNQKDKTIAATGSNRAIAIYDTSYTDKDTFKTAMSGVMLYYEIEEPTETDVLSYFTDAMMSFFDPHSIVRFADANKIHPVCEADFIGRFS